MTKYLVISILLFTSNFAISQQDTSIVINGKGGSVFVSDTSKQVVADTISNDRIPWKAAVYSMILPGLGQAYNRQYWKIPIFYTILGSTILWANYNNQNYKRFDAAYELESDSLSSTVSEFNHWTLEQISSYRKRSRRDRDMAIILTVATYGFNIMNAVVDAHLADYDIGDDLSFKVTPIIMVADRNKNILGLGMSFRF